MSEFDKKARTWDEDPMHIERAKRTATAIKEMIILNQEMNALEFGSGTGLLSFELKDFVGDITMMDNSEEMINVLSEKIEKSGIKKMKPLLFDLIGNDYKKTTFDLIYSLMVLHHINDLNNLISKFAGLLNKNGVLAIADIYKEDGTFHDSSFAGHNGFLPEDLEKILREKGFTSVKHKIYYTINKPLPSGEVKGFPVFLIVAEKN